MRALSYLFAARWKNWLKSLIKSPVQLIVLLLIVGLLVFTILTPRFSEPEEYRDVSELFAIMILLFAAMYIMTCFNGITRGGSLFSMADVNLAFVSPIRSNKILFYGLIQQLGTSIMVGLFLLYQYAWINMTYGVSFGFILLVLLGYGLCVYCGQVTSMVIYANVSDSLKKRRIAKSIILGLCAVAAGYIAYQVYTDSRDIIPAAVAAINSKVFAFFPVAGWLKSAIAGVFFGNILSAVLWGCVVIIYIVIVAILISRTGDSYYEDVLQSTERTFKAVTASKSGQISEATPENIKLGKLGIGKGFGSSTLYYKHRLEDRRARVLIFDTLTLVFMGVSIIFAFFMRNEGIAPIFLFSTYMMIFSAWTGRWVKELVRHYIYLIPETPFRKLLYCIRGTAQKIFLESLIFYLIISTFADVTVPEVILAIITRASFGLLFMSANIFIERFFSTVTVKFIAVMLYFLSMILFAVPGIILAVVLSITQAIPLPENILILASLLVCNIIVTLVAMYASRNMLEYAELNN